MKKIYAAALGLLMVAGAAGAQKTQRSKVYFTSDITPEGLIKVYEALGVPANGKVAMKISTGESEKSHQLSPELIGKLVKMVNGRPEGGGGPVWGR